MDRTFRATDRTGNEREFELIPPNLAAENEGERQYRIAYSHALKEGIFPKEKLREIMREHEMWTEADDRELREIVASMAVLQIELQAAQKRGDDDKCLHIARDLSDGRSRMWELFLVQQTVYMNSAEGVAETIKLEAVMAACTVVKATNKRYWENYGDFVQERDFNTKSTVHPSVVTLQSTILDELRQCVVDDYPEKQYLKDISDRMMDREVEEAVISKLKERAEVVFRHVGLTPSEAIHLFYRQVALRGELPVELKLPNRLTRDAIEDARHSKDLINADSAEELFALMDRDN